MRIMVLNDKDTFSTLDGCEILEVPDGSTTEEIEALIEEGGRRVGIFTGGEYDPDWAARIIRGLLYDDDDRGQPHWEREAERYLSGQTPKEDL